MALGRTPDSQVIMMLLLAHCIAMRKSVCAYPVQQSSTPHTWMSRWEETGCPHQPCWQLEPGTGTACFPLALKPREKETVGDSFAMCLKMWLVCWDQYVLYDAPRTTTCYYTNHATHSVGSLTDSLNIGLVPFSRDAIDDFTVINKVTSDVGTTYKSGLFPGQNHWIPHTFQHRDAIGWSGWSWHNKIIQLAFTVKGQHWLSNCEPAIWM